MDIFGQVPLKKQVECICPNCERNLAANRFAPHLEKCMGMGRNSSRLASRRYAIIVNNNSCKISACFPYCCSISVKLVFQLLYL